LQGTVEAIDVAGTGLKVPHMGWNTLIAHTSHPVLAGVATPDQATGASVYFVHSFHVKPSAPDLIATATYGHAVNAVIGRENMIGTQFHPEKSQRAGLQLLANFLTWRPR
ncbi:MAG: imidazole glycerol phosphate synthase subunit HisH, partial [Pseudomonadota bacterium]